MRVIAAPEPDVQCAGDDAIVGERALARQQPTILNPLDACADAFWPQPKPEIRAFEPELVFATVSHRRAAPSPVWGTRIGGQNQKPPAAIDRLLSGVTCRRRPNSRPGPAFRVEPLQTKDSGFAPGGCGISDPHPTLLRSISIY
jgi:hypothetical protein